MDCVRAQGRNFVNSPPLESPPPTSPLLFSNPVAQFKSYQSEILKAIERVCTNGPYILGPEVEAFEAEFAAYHGLAQSVGVGSGTDALSLTLRAYGIGPGDEVITVAHTALATLAAIISTGATPVCVDIEPTFYTLDPAGLEEMITPRTRALIPVHLYGQPCEMDSILSVAKRHNLTVIEDCAQAHGATYKGKKVGTLGDAGCFSFYPTKNLGAIGDGGGVITSDHGIAERIKRLRQYGWDTGRIGVESGLLSRLDEVQAAILRIKLKYLDADNQKRRTLAALYTEHLDGKGLILPAQRTGCEPVYHLYVIQTEARDHLRESLRAKGVEPGIHYALPAHLHPGYFSRIVLPPKGLPVTESAAHRVLSLPLYPELENNHVEKIAEILCQTL